MNARSFRFGNVYIFYALFPFAWSTRPANNKTECVARITSHSNDNRLPFKCLPFNITKENVSPTENPLADFLDIWWTDPLKLDTF